VLPLAEVVVVCHLLAVGRAAPRRQGWIPCSPPFLAAIGLTHDAQAAVVRSLRGKGLVGRKVIDGKRHLRVDLDALDRWLAKVGNGTRYNN
jgi:hypothetical protein